MKAICVESIRNNVSRHNVIKNLLDGAAVSGASDGLVDGMLVVGARLGTSDGITKMQKN